MNFDIVIPARKNSKGVPKKNQMLLEYTMKQIPIKYHPKVIVSTDDDIVSRVIKNKYNRCRVHNRSVSSAIDTAPTKDCISEVIEHYGLRGDILMLYLTYPEREWDKVKEAYELYKKKGSKSLLCREELKTSPYLCMYELPENKGKQIIEHNLYRRQDYPKCFKLCHMISLFSVNEFKKLNNNLYNEDTVFYKIKSALDVDTMCDLEKMRGKK